MFLIKTSFGLSSKLQNKVFLVSIPLKSQDNFLAIFFQLQTQKVKGDKTLCEYPGTLSLYISRNITCTESQKNQSDSRQRSNLCIVYIFLQKAVVCFVALRVGLLNLSIYVYVVHRRCSFLCINILRCHQTTATRCLVVFFYKFSVDNAV